MDIEAERTVPDWWPYGNEFPDWHVWLGVTGLLYASRMRSSPPKLVRAKSTVDLRDQIRNWRRLWGPLDMPTNA